MWNSLSYYDRCHMRLINKQPITTHLSVNNCQSEYVKVNKYSSNQEAGSELDPTCTCSSLIGAVTSVACCRGFLSPLLSLVTSFSRLCSKRKPLGPGYLHVQVWKLTKLQILIKINALPDVLFYLRAWSRFTKYHVAIHALFMALHYNFSPNPQKGPCVQ